MQENQPCRCPKQTTKSKDCQNSCWHDFFISLKKEILDCKEEVKELIRSKLPDPPVVLVDSREVCRYVAIEPKTLYRCEQKKWITCYLRNRKGKFYLQEDMVKLKKIYHNLPD